MSETGIESDAGGSSINNRFFCHSCSSEIDHADDFKCPLCASGFVELLEETEAQQQVSEQDNLEQNTSQSEPHSRRNVFHRQSFIHHGLPRTRRIISNFGLINGASTDATAIIQDVLRISDQLMAPELMAVGNMGDYALSRTGLDAIVSQLLNQMDSSGGPPPLSESLIESLPYVTIAQEHIHENSQCSICWEKFSIDEQVRKLPCSHIYHDDCIKPWLSQRCTCPICRKPVASSSNNSDIEVMDDASSHLSSISSDSTSSDSTSSDSTSTSSSSVPFPLVIPTVNTDSSSLDMESLPSSSSSAMSSASVFDLSSSSSSPSTLASQSPDTTAPLPVSPRVTLTLSSSITDHSFATDSFEDEIDYFGVDFESSTTFESD